MTWQATNDYRNRIKWNPTLTCWNGSTHTTIPWPQVSEKGYYTFRQGIVAAEMTFDAWNPGSDPAWALNDGQEWRLTAPPIPIKSQSGFSNKLVGVAWQHTFGGYGSSFDLHYEMSTNRLKFLCKWEQYPFLELLTNGNKNNYLKAFLGQQGGLGVQLYYEADT